MLSRKYARCSPVLQFGKCHSTKEYRWQVLLHLRTWSRKSLCKGRQVQFVPIRHFFKRKTAEGVSFKPLHKEDGVSEKFRLVFYNGSMNYYVYGVRAIYAVVAAIGVVLVIFAVKRYWHGAEWSTAERTSVGRYSIGDPVYFWLAGIPLFILCTLGVLRLSQNVPLRIYHDKSTSRYAARLLRFGLYEETIEFSQRDVRRIDKPSMWTGNVSISGRNVLIVEENFETVGDFNKFMGYDYERASDFELQESNENVVEMIQKGLREHQNNKYKSFEQKYLEKRRLKYTK